MGGTGLELTRAESGQVSINSHAGASVEGTKCVDFRVELRPSWYSVTAHAHRLKQTLPERPSLLNCVREPLKRNTLGLSQAINGIESPTTNLG